MSLAALQITLRLRGVLEWVALADRDGNPAVGNRIEQFVCTPGEFFVRSVEMSPQRPGQIHRTRRVEALRVDGRDGPTCGAEQCERAADREAGQARVESRLADAVEHRGDAFATGELANPCPELIRVCGVVEYFHGTRT